jgi:PAS domain S-box-containing protein
MERRSFYGLQRPFGMWDGHMIEINMDDRADIKALKDQIKDYQKRLENHRGVQRSLKESQDRYRTVFENTGTATFVMAADQTITVVNTGFERLIGLTKSEVEGRITLYDLVDASQCEALTQYNTDRQGANKGPEELACTLVMRSGTCKDVLLKLDLIPGTGECIGCMMDITRIKRAQVDLREQRARLAAILDAFEGQIYVCDTDYRLAYANEHLIARIGARAVGQPCYEVIHARQAPCPFCVLDQVRSGQTVRFEVKNPGDQRWYYSMNAPIRHVDGSISLLAMITDISDRKNAEQALRESEIHLLNENIILRTQIKERTKFGHIVGQSPAMQQVYEHILNAAASDATVIIFGEPGTGKELVAHAIHDMSERRNNRFVPVHCGAIPENLIESEFFGYKKGAFSGALTDKAGYLEFADSGTLFLDEVGEISPHMQVKLLRVIEGSGYTPVGSSQNKSSNVRIIGATNRDLKLLVKNGLMREDFFYRIHILPIHLPPLRERKDDMSLLINHFMNLYAGKRNVPPLTTKLMEKLYHYNWPGNVRELQNVIVRYCNQRQIDLTGASAKPEAPPNQMSFPGGDGKSPKDLNAMLAKYEQLLILTTLNQHQWHRQNVARTLGVDRKTLFNKMKRYGLLSRKG